MSRASYFQNIVRSFATMPVLQPAHSIAPRPEAPFSLDVPLEPAQQINVVPPSNSQPVVERPGTAHLQQPAQAPVTEIVTRDKGYSANIVPLDRDSFATAQSNTAPLVPNSMQRPLETEATLSLTTPISQTHSKRRQALGASPVDTLFPFPSSSLTPAHVMPLSQEAGPTAQQEPATARKPHKASLAGPHSPKEDVIRQRPTEEIGEEPALAPTATLRPQPVPLQPRLEEKAGRFQAHAAEKQQKATLSIGSIDVYIVPPTPAVPAPPKAAEVKSAPNVRSTGALSRVLLSSIGLRQG